jgi:hypothetical protein
VSLPAGDRVRFEEVPAMTQLQRYKFLVLARYPAGLRGNDAHVSVKMLAGENDHLAYCGTLTMTDRQWEDLSMVLQKSHAVSVEVEGP